MKIVFLDAGTLFNARNLGKLAELGEYVEYAHTLPSDVIERLNGASIAISNKVVINKETIEQCPSLRLICVAATGTNNIDKEFAALKGIEVKNATDYSTHSVAQVTFTMLLYLLNNPFYYDDYIKSGKYIKNEFFTHVGKPYWQLAGKRLGIIGLGNIGKQVAKIAEAFGMEVVFCSVSGKNEHPEYKKLSLDELLKTSDVVSLHCPLTDLTKNLLTYERICQMQTHAFLINVSRGGVVPESDLVRALDENRIAGAGLDVFEHEPISAKNPIYSLKNKDKIVLAPHLAWASIEARELLVEKIYANIQKFLD